VTAAGGGRRLLVGAGIALAGAALAVGCGGSSKPSASATTATTASTAPATVATTTTSAAKDPCSYVTKAEVGGATGKTVTGTSSPNDSSCSYATSDGGVVNTGVASPVTAAAVEQQIENASGVHTPPATVPGIGDVAYATNGGLEVLKGSTAVSVVVFGNGAYASPGNSDAVAIARLILGRL
jgi:hypothetical protein